MIFVPGEHFKSGIMHTHGKGTVSLVKLKRRSSSAWSERTLTGEVVSSKLTCDTEQRKPSCSNWLLRMVTRGNSLTRINPQARKRARKSGRGVVHFQEVFLNTKALLRFVLFWYPIWYIIDTMCRTGGPRCPKEAKKSLDKAKEAFLKDKSVKNKNLYHQKLEEYHLTRQGLDELKAALETLKNRNDQKAVNALEARVERLEWKRARLVKSKQVAKHCQDYINEISEKFPDAQAHFDDLIEEGKPFPPPTKANVEEWMGRNRKDGEPMPFSGSQYYAVKNLLRRCQYHEVISGISGLTEIEEPGAQADQYPRDEEGNINELYYASYGSNMNRNRFMTYIEGGHLPGTDRVYQGCQDNEAPKDDISLKFNNPLFYAINSKLWKGGVAFLDHTAKGESLGRAYLITDSQFSDVVTQESGNQPKPDGPKISLDEVVENGVLEDHQRAYGTLVHVGDYNGRPVMTFTSKYNREDAIYGDRRFASQKDINKPGIRFMSNSPSGAYMRMISRGLEESFGLSQEDQSTYFVGASGGNYLSKKTVIKHLNTPEPEVKPAEPKESKYDPKPKSKVNKVNGYDAIPKFSNGEETSYFPSFPLASVSKKSSYPGSTFK